MECRSKANEAIAIFTKIPGAGDRLGRSYFRKYLILKALGKSKLAIEALTLAQNERLELVGSGVTAKNSMEEHDSMEAYDSLVSYYNR